MHIIHTDALILRVVSSPIRTDSDSFGTASLDPFSESKLEMRLNFPTKTASSDLDPAQAKPSDPFHNTYRNISTKLTKNKTEFMADVVVSTILLGVLKDSSINFEPALPESVRQKQFND